MHWECLGYTVLTFVAGYFCGDVFGEPRSSADRGEDGVRAYVRECACGETFALCTCPEPSNEKLKELMGRKAPWEEF
jgi:hypothetical protein